MVKSALFQAEQRRTMKNVNDSDQDKLFATPRRVTTDNRRRAGGDNERGEQGSFVHGMPS